MEIESNSQQVLLRQAVEWLKKRQETLVQKMAAEMAHIPELSYRWLPVFLRGVIARDMVKDLIIRIGENNFDAQEVRVKMLTALKRGATSQSIVRGVVLMEELITAEAQSELAAQPLVLDVLLTKTEYFVTLLKSTVASAMIELEKSKKKKV